MAACTLAKLASSRARSMVISSTCHTVSAPLRPERGSGGIGCTEMRNQRGASRSLPPPSPGGGRRNSSFRLRPCCAARDETEDRLGEMRVAGKGTVGRRHGRFGFEPEQIAIGLVGVEHAPRAVGDQRPLRQIVDKGLGDVIAGMTAAEMQDADRAGEQAEHADHGETGQDGEHERLGHLARHHGQPNGGDRQGKREENHQRHAAVAGGQIGGGRGIAHRRVDIGHGWQNSRFELCLGTMSRACDQAHASFATQRLAVTARGAASAALIVPGVGWLTSC